MLPSGKSPSLAQGLDGFGAGTSATSAVHLDEAIGQFFGLGLAGGKQRQRQDRESLQRVQGSLIHRIESTYRLDGVTKKIEPNGSGHSRWKQIENSTTNSKVTNLANQIRPLIAKSHQMVDQIVYCHLPAFFDLQLRLTQNVRWRKSTEQRTRRTDHGSELSLQQAEESNRLAGSNL